MSGKDDGASAVMKALLGDVAAEVAEVGLDQMLEDGTLKDFPVIGIAVRALSAGKSVHDAFLLAKFLYFAKHLEAVTEKQRSEFLAKLQKPGELQRFQRNVLYLLDRIEQEEKAPLLARAFTAAVRGDIPPWMFHRYASVILGCGVLDLRILYSFSPKVQGSPLPAHIARRLESFGLVREEQPPEPFVLPGQQKPRPPPKNARTRQRELSEVPVTVTPFGLDLVQTVIRKEDVTDDESEDSE